ncbi:tetratricopeptide repeat protein [Planobispora rosea]|uniref:tetratricopeptide repeat protein n=1 Tax=Planobispora rosea TaxID=35762 RepID=UPI00114D1296|nr:DUF4034 domain-containing protein [Planobispora rosea]
MPIDPCLGDAAGRMVRDAMAGRNWPVVRDFLNGVTDPDARAFYVGICSEARGVQDWIGQWIEAEPHSTLPLLVKGAHGVVWAWEARGTAYTSFTPEQQLKEFHGRLEMAEDCLEEVVERDPDDTTAWTWLVTSARGRRVGREETERRFHEAVGRHPWHVAAHEQMLQYLCRKWAGSHEEMFAFARKAVTASSPASPLGHLIADAHIEYWLSLPEGEDDLHMTHPEVRAELRSAAAQSVNHPGYRRGPGWPGPYNTFAFAFFLADDHEACRAQFQVIGDNRTEWPWSYHPLGATRAFAQIREKVTRGR